MDRRSGFTLVELLIVVAMVAALTASAVALFAGRYQKGSREHYVKNLRAVMRYAQYRAIERGQTHRLTVEGAGTLRSLVDEAGDGRFTAEEDPFTERLNRRGSFRLKFDDPGGIYFFPNGVTTPNRLTVSDGKETIATLALTNRIGSVRVEYAHRS